MRPGFLGFAQGFSARAPTSFHAEGPIYPAWTPSNCTVQIVTTSTPLPAADTKESTVCSQQLPQSRETLTLTLGAFFGTTFPHLFFQSYRELAPAPFYKPQTGANASTSPTESNSSHQSTFTNPNPHGGQKRAAGKVYTPKIYGFRVSDRAKNGPRMQWTRMRPVSPEELDMVDWRGRWIDDDEEYDDEEEEEDRQMEDFDPVSTFSDDRSGWTLIHPSQDAGDGEDDDDEEEEEEEEGGGVPRLPADKNKMRVRGSQEGSSPHPPPPSSPASSVPPRTPISVTMSNVVGVAKSPGSTGSSRVKVVRQWATTTA